MSYRDLKSYERATIIYDFTVEFVKKYIDRNSRTKDQMEQAARSGKQNIVEGSSERTSKKSELKLLGIARASFQELLEDYEDFLRQRSLTKWGKDSERAREVRGLVYKSNKSYEIYGSYMNDPESAANTAICLVNQAGFLLDKQIAALEEKFIKEGGYNERLSRGRNAELKRQIMSRFWRKFE